MKKLKIFLLVSLLCTLFYTSSIAGISILPVDKFTNKYDAIIKKETKRHFGPTFNWKFFKAQIAAESAFNPKAISPVGAKGLLQVMPGTMNDIVKKSKWIKNDSFNPRWNIAAGIWYNAKLYKTWSSPRPFNDRMCLVFASYNAGLGNPLKAQKLCLSSKNKTNCNLWLPIREQAPNVSTWKYHETFGYVTKIMYFMGYKMY